MPIDATFFSTTRGRLVDLLRRSTRTIDELAEALGITDNAVRLHIAVLERDGMVRACGVRRDGGVGKPAVLYEIDPSAEPDFSHAYIPLLNALLAALGDRLDERALRALMRDVGHRLAGGADAGEGPLLARAEAGSRLLNELGGVTTVEARGAGVVDIQGCGCPLSAAVVGHEEVCLAVQTLLADATGAHVRERCDRTGRPCCRFELTNERRS